MQPDRRTAGILVVGVLAALALTIAAATLTNPTESTGGGLIGIEGNITGLFGDEEIREPPGGPLPAVINTILSIVFVVVMIAGLVVGVFVLDARDFARIVGISLIAAVGLWLLMRLISLFTDSGGEFGIGGSGASLSGSGGGITASGGGSVSPLLLGGVGLVAMFALILLFAFSTDEGTPEPESQPEPSDVEDLDAVGRAAGRAADDIEDTAVSTSNAVYRAWVEMTEALEVSNRESTTPGEFADAAIAAGMDPDDVRELTRLFEEVRYGDEPVSTDRIERAGEALRRIESAYAGENG